MLEKVKVRLASWRLKQQRGDAVVRCFKNWSEISSLHLLCLIDQPNMVDAQKQYEEIYNILEFCKSHHISVEATVFVDHSLNEAKRVNINTLDSTHFGYFSGYPKEETWSWLDSVDADVLINLSPRTCYPLEFLAAHSKACFKIALDRTPQGACYDFLMRMEEPVTSPMPLFDAIVFYLRTIKSSE